MELLQKYLFIPLDIFRKNVHNKSEISKLDAWLILLSVDDPKTILSLINTYPEFKEIYGQVYEICRNVEDAMGLFSKELAELDRNTVQYMIDQMQEELETTNSQLKEKNSQLEETDRLYQSALRQIEELEQKLRSRA